MALSLFERRLRNAPNRPGVYIMKDVRGNVLYVGKASVLSNRLRNYFGSPANLPNKIRRMLGQLDDFECIVTDTEAEALILENTLIKRHKPRYNARLKDDKTYPYLKIDLAEDFPKVYITRKVAKDGGRYFGPFATAGTVRQTMDLIKRLFPYRSCTKAITGKDVRPCLEYYINRCVAPCTGLASKEDYAKVINQVTLFMEGDTEAVTTDLRTNMEKASEELEFERAAVLRDRMRSVQKVADEQQIKVDANPISDMDVIAFTQSDSDTWVEVFFIRHNKLVGRDHFFMDGAQDELPGLVMGQFIKQFYQSASAIPPRILLQHPLEEEELIGDWLRDLRGGAVRLVLPQRGQHKKLIDMVAENARQGLEHHRVRWLDNTDVIHGAMAELQEELSLPTDLRRMECYDISHIQGTNTVASMAVFEDGKPKSSEYRRFKIKTVEGVDDFESMREVLRRRFKRMADARAKGNRPEDNGTNSKDASWGIFPDLVLIDGGKGQLSAALEVFLEMGLDNVPLASLAKENEWLYVPHTPEPIVLARNSQALYLVQRIRDEAHRFAITYHRNLRSKSSLKSPIDLVTGIGPKRKRMLLRRFGSVSGIKQASLDEIAAVPGLTRSLAILLKQSL
ncbi:MAG: excinuclease ABC subunit C [Chloroflexi bacterium]|jgi:excinuclease ABC subunit C|nr:excinuclease ABC subunit C [Chloroflexota bacterium]MEE2926153.1 excinuclease ABC subunit UvrC [Chloroflexota bacterium]|tara:strand:- start:437 stop:2305 length:1869 start_codon:yes stop_codon:yes gene_type:complete